MTVKEIREKYLEYFTDQGHRVIPPASLIPENDPTTLFTGSGMQPMVPYLLGEKHPAGNRLVDVQKCFRAQDIEEVGDNRHTTFFEMLGNWSLGDYFKTEQIHWLFEFLTQAVGLTPERLFVTVFRGQKQLGIPRDEETVKIWQQIFSQVGLEAKVVDRAEKNGLQDGRIFYYGEQKNWWSRSGITSQMPVGEPGGPDSEIFWDFGEQLGQHKNSSFKNQPCHPNCDCGRFMEIGNSVFMQYVKTENGFKPLPQNNVDFGGGLERIAAASIDTPDIFQIDVFRPIIQEIERNTGQEYKSSSPGIKKEMRIIADHVRAATMIMTDVNGVNPSNLDQGYIVRRLIRRAILAARNLSIRQDDFFANLLTKVIKFYPEIKAREQSSLANLCAEETKFKKTLEKGLKEFQKMSFDKVVSGAEAFILFSTYGFPLEIVQEMAEEKKLRVDVAGFKSAMKKHQALSRSATAGKFKGGLVDVSELTTKLHTATHLLQAALRQVLSDKVRQKGSNITAERLRFDFNYPEKLSVEQIAEVEKLVNNWIESKLVIQCEELSYAEAKKKNPIGLFENKYGDQVKVYSIGDISCELCGGPHVKNTGELGHFKIKKEQSSGAGVRRIKAVLL